MTTHNTDCVDQLLRKQATSKPDTVQARSMNSYLKSVRWRVAYVGLFGGFIVYLYRINMNLVLPYMVKSSQDSMEVHVAINTSLVNSSKMTSNDYTSVTLTPNVYNSTVEYLDHNNRYNDTEDCVDSSGLQTDTFQGGQFLWDRKIQAVILSSYYYGFLVSQVPFSWVTSKFGGKHVMSSSMLLATVVTFLLPVMAKTSAYAVVAVRFVLGVCSGASLAAWYTLLSRWALTDERSRFTAIFWFGQTMGTIVGYFTSGFLCANGFADGWDSVFYTNGILGVLFVILWVYVIAEYPESHSGISDAELRLLRQRSTAIDIADKRKSVKVPWLKILTHGPVLATITTQTLDCFVHYLVLICLPLYMKAVLKFDIQSNGVYTSLPFVFCACGLFVSGMLADMMVSRKYLTATSTRKVIQVIALVGTAVGICLPGFMTCNQRGLVIMCLCICMFFEAGGYSSGYTACPVDIAPRYASVIYSISNSFGTLSGILSPFAVAELTPHDTAAEWRVVFFIAAGCAVIAAVVFGLFSSSELAPWAVEPGTEIEVTVDKDKSVIQPMVTETRCDWKDDDVVL